MRTLYHKKNKKKILGKREAIHRAKREKNVDNVDNLVESFDYWKPDAGEKSRKSVKYASFGAQGAGNIM